MPLGFKDIISIFQRVLLSQQGWLILAIYQWVSLKTYGLDNLSN